MAPKRTPQDERLATANAWWSLLARILSFFLGGAIFTFETAFEHIDRPWLLICAVAMMGPTIATSVAAIVTAARGRE